MNGNVNNGGLPGAAREIAHTPAAVQITIPPPQKKMEQTILVRYTLGTSQLTKQPKGQAMRP